MVFLFKGDLMRKEGVLLVETLKDSSVCSWMNKIFRK